MGKIHQAEFHVVGECLVPVGAGARRRHQLLHDRLALGLVTGERGRDIRLRLQRLHQRDRVLDGEPRSRPDREMGRVQGVADQHHIPQRPAFVPDPREIAPDRFVGHQGMSVQGGREHPLANRLRLLDGLVGETVSLPRRGVALDHADKVRYANAKVKYM